MDYLRGQFVTDIHATLAMRGEICFSLAPPFSVALAGGFLFDLASSLVNSRHFGATQHGQIGPCSTRQRSPVAATL
jgi:hypothetical protein